MSNQDLLKQLKQLENLIERTKRNIAIYQANYEDAKLTLTSLEAQREAIELELKKETNSIR